MPLLLLDKEMEVLDGGSTSKDSGSGKNGREADFVEAEAEAGGGEEGMKGWLS